MRGMPKASVLPEPVGVRARRVVGEVEVEDEPPVLHPQVGSLHRVEQVAAGTVRLRAARRIGERDEQSPAVALEPVELERAEIEAGDREAPEGEAVDLDRLRCDRLDVRPEAQRRVVLEVRERPVAGRRRLRMVAEELLAHGAPALPPHARLRFPHLRVQLEDASLPVEEIDLVDHAPTTASVVLRSGTSVRNHDRTNASPEMAAPTRNTGCNAFENAWT